MSWSAQTKWVWSLEDQQPYILNHKPLTLKAAGPVFESIFISPAHVALQNFAVTFTRAPFLSDMLLGLIPETGPLQCRAQIVALPSSRDDLIEELLLMLQERASRRNHGKLLAATFMR